MLPPFPLSSRGVYQVVVVVPEGDTVAEAHAAEFSRALASAMTGLGMIPAKTLVCFDRIVPLDPDRRQPCVGVFFGSVEGPKLRATDIDRLDLLVEDGRVVIPVVEDLRRLRLMAPGGIAHLNGLERRECGADFERLASRVLEGFGLLRERRRLFISYRRTESSGVATQLYELLDVAGFDVFLDTSGALRPGDPFQEILWHRLADTDVILLLDTPGFLESRWTEAELARANTANLQILQVLWPSREEMTAAAFSTFYPLSETDFASDEMVGPAARLRDDSAARIVDQVEGLRARAFAARHSFLVREFIMEARRAGFDAYMTMDKSIVLRPRGVPGALGTFVLPAVGVPDAERYEALERTMRREAVAGRSYLGLPCILYDESGIRTRWLDHLDWLNGNLVSVRGVGLKGAMDWLNSLAATHGGHAR